LRQPCFTADIGEQKRGERGVFRRFQHHRIPGGERRRDLPGQHQEREVPRDDLAADAKRLAPGVLLQQLGEAGVVVEMPLGEGHVDVAASRIGLPLSSVSSTAKSGRASAGAGRLRKEISRPLVARQLRPGAGARAADGRIHVIGAACVTSSQHRFAAWRGSSWRRCPRIR
jgi:hypothetical protein